jgi:WD40 repeat protein
VKRCILGFILLGSTVFADTSVSFHRDIAPIFRRSCNGCHRPGKSKGGLELTSFATVIKGGKHGQILKPGDPQDSELVEQIIGDEPEMPKEGDPLTPEEVAAIQRWIAEGATDDTPADAGIHKLSGPPKYRVLPAVSALAWSPDGRLLAVSGFHEILLHSADGAQIVNRLVGESPRIESICFSSDGRLLAAAGGAPAEYGEIQIWQVADGRLLQSIKTTSDDVFGISFSVDDSRVAVGCSDKTVRAFNVQDGHEVMKCDNHLDWVFATAFTHDGTRLVSASRDRAIKLIEVATGRLIDDVNRPRDAVLSLARHPVDDLIVTGDEKGGIRMHRMAPRAGRLKEGDDKEESFVRELERLGGAVQAVAFSANGEALAAGSTNGEAKIYKVSDGKRIATVKTNFGPIFAVALRPDGQQVATGGLDGKVRLFQAVSGEIVRAFDAVPIESEPVASVAQ